MEDLTKNQLILLALLVSFVTSIAASIATASLLDQAPPRVTQTIHRVVERTIETVVPSSDPKKPDVVTQEKTVIVREEDAITDAIALVSPSLVRVYLTKDAAENDGNDATVGSDSASRFSGLAAIVNEKGTLITSSAFIVSGTYDVYEVTLSDGTIMMATVKNRQPELGMALLTLDNPSGITLPKPIVLNDDNNLRLGQTVLGLGGRDKTSVGIGIISAIDVSGEGAVSQVTASISSDVAGMPLVNLFGEIIGFAKNSNLQVFVPASRAQSVLSTSS